MRLSKHKPRTYYARDIVAERLCHVHQHRLLRVCARERETVCA